MIRTLRHTGSCRQLTIHLPASKSISNRLLILNALSESPYPIENLAHCDDTDVLVRILESDEGTVFNVGAAGTAMRFLTAYLSKIGGHWTLTGSERMKNRPIRILVEALNFLGAKISYIEKEGFPPLKIEGRALIGGEIEMDASISSQYISALMMVAPTMRDGLTLHFPSPPISTPYLLLTQQIMGDFGIQSTFNGKTLKIAAGQAYRPVPYRVESDWSAVSYWYELVALSREPIEVTLPFLQKNSRQGDAAGAELFESLGVKTRYTKEGVVICKQPLSTKKLTHNFTNEPDLTQTFVATCCGLDIPFYFSGLQSLKIKETDRIAALITELRKLGYDIREEKPNTLSWNGERIPKEETPVIRTYEDHRMAMAFAPLALRLGEIKIENPEVVTKSYPNFWDDLARFGLAEE